MLRRLTALVLLLPLLLLTSGCNQQGAQKAESVITLVLNVAQADSDLVPSADLSIYNSFVSLGQTLNSQLNTCINGTKPSFSSCFNAFASGLTSPTELARLRLMSAKTQSKVQLIVAAIITAVNIVTTFVTPTLTSTPTTSSELHEFANTHNIHGDGF
jgi:hypothetical protein